MKEHYKLTVHQKDGTIDTTDVCSLKIIEKIMRLCFKAQVEAYAVDINGETVGASWREGAWWNWFTVSEPIPTLD